MVLLTGLFGAGLLIAADLSTLYVVDVVTVTKASVSGHAQHGYALAVLGLAGVLLALGARQSRLAMLLLAIVGLVSLGVIVAAGDLHDVHSSGTIGQLYENATARPARGFYFETLGGVLLVGGGFGALLAARTGVDRRRPGVRPGAEEPGAGPPRDEAPGPPTPARRSARPDREREPDDWFG